MNNWFLLAAIPVFGICVLVHEFGHFITAKWAGIRVEEFGLGFPPIWRFQSHHLFAKFPAHWRLRANAWGEWGYKRRGGSIRSTEFCR